MQLSGHLAVELGGKSPNYFAGSHFSETIVVIGIWGLGRISECNSADG
jgi:hypothetical protein